MFSSQLWDIISSAGPGSVLGLLPAGRIWYTSSKSWPRDILITCSSHLDCFSKSEKQSFLGDWAPHIIMRILLQQHRGGTWFLFILTNLFLLSQLLTIGKDRDGNWTLNRVHCPVTDTKLKHFQFGWYNTEVLIRFLSWSWLCKKW